MRSPERVRDRTLELLSEESRRYTELVNELERPDKTIFVTLRDLQQEGLVQKNQEGKYELTKKGLQVLELNRETVKLGRKLAAATEVGAFKGVTEGVLKIRLQRVYTLATYLRLCYGEVPSGILPARRERNLQFFESHAGEAGRVQELGACFVRLAPRLHLKTKKRVWQRKGYWDWANALIDRAASNEVRGKFKIREYDALDEYSTERLNEMTDWLIAELLKEIRSFPSIPGLESFITYMKSLVEETAKEHEAAKMQEANR